MEVIPIQELNTNTQDSNTMPLLTPIIPIPPPSSTPLNMPTITTAPTHQTPLFPERKNEPWGDYWAMNQPTNLFRVISKNTGTINLENLDMQAITKELNFLTASVFATQETNLTGLKLLCTTS